MSRSIWLLLSVIALPGCTRPLHVERIAQLEYPLSARFSNTEGTVIVTVIIGPDGKVISAHGSGAADILVKAAEENARQWVFGPFPPVAEFPIYHTIRYVYRLEGKAKAVAYNPTIRTFLPDRIEISAAPLFSDYPPPQEYKQLK